MRTATAADPAETLAFASRAHARVLCASVACSLLDAASMRNAFISELDGHWVVTLVEIGELRRQQYHCDSLALAKRWAQLLGSPLRLNERVIKPLPAA